MRFDITKLEGKFIVLDGIEGGGKSSQAQLLKQDLELMGSHVTVVRDPGTTRISEQVRGILLNPDHNEMSMRTETLLYMAARAQMLAEVIFPALDKGHTVVSDRFISSTLAYQSCEEISIREIMELSKFVLQHKGVAWMPDLTVILDMPVDVATQRINRAKDRIEQRSVEYHRSVREKFLLTSDIMPSCVINADQEPGRVHADIMQALGKHFS